MVGGIIENADGVTRHSAQAYRRMQNTPIALRQDSCGDENIAIARRVHVCSRKQICKHIYIYIRVSMCIHAYTYLYIYIHISNPFGA